MELFYINERTNSCLPDSQQFNIKKIIFR